MKKIVLLAVALVTMTQVQAESRNDRNQQVSVENRMDRRHFKDGDPAERRTERMAKELNLNEEQKAQVLDLNKRYADMFRHPGHHGKHKPMGGKGCCCKGEGKGPKGDLDGKAPAAPDFDKQPQDFDKQPQDGKKKPDFDKKPDMKEMKAKREAYNKELKTILTKEQYKLYEQHQKERKEKMKKDHHA